MTRKIYYQKKKPVGYLWKKKVSRDTGEAVILGTFVIALVAVTLVYWNYQKNLKIGKKYNAIRKNKIMIGEEDMAKCEVGRRRYYLQDKINKSNLNDVMTPSIHCESFKEKIIYA